MDREPPQRLTPDELALVAAIPWDRVMLDSWGEGWGWPVGPILDWLEIAVITIEEWIRDAVFHPIIDWFQGLASTLGVIWTDLRNWVANSLIAARNWIRDRISDAITALTTVLNWLGRHVTFYAAWVRDRVWEAARWIRDQVAGGWNWLGTHVTVYAAWVRDRVWEAASWLWSVVWAGITNVSTWIWSAAKWLWSVVGAGITNVSTWVWDAAKWLADRLREGWDWLWNLTKGAFEAIGRQIDATLQWFQDHVIDPITDHLWSWWAAVKLWAGDRVYAAWQAFLRLFAQPYHGSFSLVDVLKGIWGGFVATIKAITGGIAAFFGTLWSVFIAPIKIELLFVLSNLEIILPHVPPGARPGQAFDIYGSMGMAMLDRHMRAVGSLFMMKLQPGAWFVDTSFIEKMAYQSIGFDQLLQAAYIPAFDIAVGRNIRWRMNRDWRNELPSRGELEEMFAKHEISTDLFNETMAMHGFSSEWLDIFRSALYRDPRMHEVMRLSEIFAPPTTPDSRAIEYANRGGAPGVSGPDWWYSLKMAKAGYDDTDIPILVQAIKAMNRRREQTLYIMQLRRLHRAGYMTEPEIIAGLVGDQNPVPMRPDVAAARMQGMRMERLYEETRIREDVIRDQFRKGAIDDDELDLALSAVIVDDSQRTLVLSEERLRRFPTVKIAKPPDPNKALLALQREQQRLAIAQFRAYLLDADELRAHLQVIGLTATFATVITDLEVVRRDAKARPVTLVYQTDTGRAQLQEAKLQYRAGLISDADLYTSLLAIEVPENMARALVGQELARIAGRPVKPPPEEPPYYATAVGRTRIRALQLQFRAGEIDDGRLFSGFSGLGIDPDYAQALVDVELARRAGLVQPKVAPELPTYRTEEGRARIRALQLQFRAGEIDDARLLSGFLDLTIDPGHAQALVDVELARRAGLVQPEPTPEIPTYRTEEGKIRVTNLRLAFRKELIDDRDLLASLIELEMPRPTAEAIVEQEIIRLFTPDEV